MSSQTQLLRFPCKLVELSLDLSLNCGQSFRWKKRPTGEWIGVLKEKVWILSQNDDHVSYRCISPAINEEAKEENLKEPPCSIRDEEFLRDYFQLDVSLEKLYAEWSQADPNFLKVAKDFQGVRMLRQDPVENVFSFICSSNNNIQRISGMVEKLCQHFGTFLLTFEDVAYYNFPSIQALSGPEVESKLRTLGFGYRAKFIQQSAMKILENGGRDWLLGLRELPYSEAKCALMALPGIGAKVADCICLMSLNHSLAIPVDTHVFQIAKASYVPHLGSAKSVTERVYNEISSHFQTLWGPYSGWAHSVLFSADLRHLKRPASHSDANSSSKSGRKSKKSRGHVNK